MVQVQSQVNALAEQVTRQLSRTLAAQLEPVLRTSRVQVPPETLQSITASQTAILKSLDPIMPQIAAQQKVWIEQALAPLTKKIQLPQVAIDPIITPELAAAMQRINENLRVPLAPLDEDDFDRVSELIDAGEVDETLLEAAELGLNADESLQVSIDEAADVLARGRKGMSRARARQVVVFSVWLAWLGALVALVVLDAPVAGVVAGALDPKNAAGMAFDKAFPPEQDSTDD